MAVVFFPASLDGRLDDWVRAHPPTHPSNPPLQHLIRTASSSSIFLAVYTVKVTQTTHPPTHPFKQALHAAEPAVDEKWVSQVWIRQGPYAGVPTRRVVPLI